MAPKKNNPTTTFSCTGATKDMFGRNMQKIPRQRKNTQPEKQQGREVSSSRILKAFLSKSITTSLQGSHKLKPLREAATSVCFCGKKWDPN